MIVTDVEAAFMYCHQLPDRDNYKQLSYGTEYMVVNLGGIVHFKLSFIFANEFLSVLLLLTF